MQYWSPPNHPPDLYWPPIPRQKLPQKQPGGRGGSTSTKITRALLAYIITVTKLSNREKSLTFKDCTTSYSAILPFLLYVSHLTCSTTHFQGLLILFLPQGNIENYKHAYEGYNYEKEKVSVLNYKEKEHFF